MTGGAESKVVTLLEELCKSGEPHQTDTAEPHSAGMDVFTVGSCIQTAILNLPHPYLRSTTVLLYMKQGLIMHIKYCKENSDSRAV